jgi:endo-1,4-beta-xylanase
MRIRSDGLCAIAVVLALIGCGGSDPLTPETSSEVGGAAAAAGGAAAEFGGSRATSSSAMGGISAGGSGASSSGASTDRGGNAAGGRGSSDGTRSASGGAQSSGGPAAGGSRAMSGVSATGGASAGGKAAAGGPAAGGSNSAAGTPATGGRIASGGRGAVGGTKAAAGASAIGGTKAAGGTTASGTSTATVAKFVGNITTGNSVDPSGLTYSKYWDQITPENQGKWGSVQSSPTGAFNWSSLDSIYKYAQTNNIIFKQHCFVWGSQQPSGTPTLAQVESWIKSFCERYPDTKLIDVVNEPPPHTTPKYTANLGAGESGTYPWITMAFKLARKYCGNAILILNDYNNVELTNDRNHTVDIVKDIKTNGAPIDAVGCQSHGLKGASASTVQTNLAYLNSQTGLPIYITEFDIDNSDDNGQLNSFKTLMPIFLDTSYVHGVTVWGWIYGSTWETASGIVKGTTPRAAMTWLMGELGRPVPPN